ncbi:hypothetical protein [Flavobacterium sp. 3HN19-14]|uniref:hypothetical protein n=1 Tax=Flavobacterium sp. 3HN19-14 TaxID=3448133 RepID=UPI003EDFD0D1
MKKILSLLGSIAFTFAGNAQLHQYKVNEKDLAATLKTLSSDEFEGREAGTPGIEKAAVFLENYFKSIKVKPYFTTYRDTLTNFNKTTCNIVGYIEGKLPGSQKRIYHSWRTL